MPVRSRILVVVLFASVACITTPFIFKREPSHGGLSLSDWLDRFNSQMSDQTERETARIAIQQIGSKAVPYLLRMLQHKDSAVKVKLVRLLAKQSVVHVRFSWSEEQHEKAVRGFEALGSAGQNAMWPLVALLNDTNAGAARISYRSFPPLAPAAQRALEALGIDVILATIPMVTNEMCQRWLYHDLISTDFLYGNEVHRIVPVIGRVLEECRFPDIRADAAARLGATQSWPDLKIALLIRSLILDSDVAVKQRAAYTLSHYGPRASNAVPALLWARSLAGVRESAITALRVIDADAMVDFDRGMRMRTDWPAEYLPLPPL
jgi:hypothetical protein